MILGGRSVSVSVNILIPSLFIYNRFEGVVAVESLIFLAVQREALLPHIEPLQRHQQQQKIQVA